MHTRPLILVAAVSTLFISACSQTESALPTLAPQLGPPGTVAAVGVALNKAGHLYTLTEDYSAYEDEDFGHVQEQRALLSRYDRNGNLLWEREVGGSLCRTDYDLDCGNLDALDVAVDGSGNAYSLTYSESYACDAGLHTYSAHIGKRNSAGTELWFRGDAASVAAFTVDTGGNVYTVGNNDTGYGEGCDGIGHVDPPYAKIVRKYGTNGNLLWERTLNVGTPTDVAVSGSGSVYVVGTAGMSRYSSLGSLTWRKSASAHEVVVSGSNLFTRSGNTLRRFDGTGKQLWSKGVSGLNTPTPFRIAGDTGGNLYLAGTSKTPSGGHDAFSRKYSGSGGLVWSKLFGTAKYDAALTITSYDGSEVYVAGETQGVLTEANRSGSQGYLRKMDRNGNRIWTR